MAIYRSVFMLIGIVFLCSRIDGSENNQKLINRTNVVSTIARKRSPLIPQDDDPVEGIRSLFETQEKTTVIQLHQEPFIGISKILQHKAHKYSILLQLAPIERARATAIVNTYFPASQAPEVSKSIFEQAGETFTRELARMHKEHLALFKNLIRQPGNSLIISPNCGPRLGNLDINFMALMYLPRIVHKKEQQQTVSKIMDGVTTLLSRTLYAFLEKFDATGAGVVVPALGSDEFFSGYPQDLMAKSLVKIVADTLRFLHETGKKRLKCVGFIVRNPDEFRVYSQAFQDFYASKKIYPKSDTDIPDNIFEVIEK